MNYYDWVLWKFEKMSELGDDDVEVFEGNLNDLIK